MKEAMNQLRTSLQNAPVIWKGDYPYFIHPVTDGVPRMDPDVLKAIVELTVERGLESSRCAAWNRSDGAAARSPAQHGHRRSVGRGS